MEGIYGGGGGAHSRGIHSEYWPLRILGIPARQHSAAVSSHLACRRHGKHDLLADGGRSSGYHHHCRTHISSLREDRAAEASAPCRWRCTMASLAGDSRAHSSAHHSYQRRTEHGHKPHGQRILLKQYATESCCRESYLLLRGVGYASGEHRRAIPIHGRR